MLRRDSENTQAVEDWGIEASSTSALGILLRLDVVSRGTKITHYVQWIEVA
jgi:hypothetical protein